MLSIDKPFDASACAAMRNPKAQSWVQTVAMACGRVRLLMETEYMTIGYHNVLCHPHTWGGHAYDRLERSMVQ